MSKGQFGVAGLGVMGQMIALNIERNGFPWSPTTGVKKKPIVCARRRKVRTSK